MNNIFLFCGNDKFSIRDHIQKIIDGRKDSAIIRYEGREFVLEKTINEIRFKDLFNPTKTIIIEYDIFHADKKEQDLFVTVLKEAPTENITIFICPKILKSSSIYRRIFAKIDNVLTYNQPKGNNKKDVINYISKVLKEKSIDINNNLIKLLVELMGYDASIILFEIKRLYKKYGRLNEKIIKEHIPKTYFNLFDIMEVLSKRDIKRTLTMYDAFIDSGFNFHEIFMALYKQIRLLFLIRMLMKDYGMIDYNQIAGILKAHPYQIRKNLEFVKNYSYKELQNAFKTLLDYQRKMYNNSNNATMILKVMITEILSK